MIAFLKRHAATIVIASITIAASSIVVMIDAHVLSSIIAFAMTTIDAHVSTASVVFVHRAVTTITTIALMTFASSTIGGMMQHAHVIVSITSSTIAVAIITTIIVSCIAMMRTR